jgi:hypothetical protein
MIARLSVVAIAFGLALAAVGFGQSAKSDPHANGGPASRRPVIYVLPNALMSPGPGCNSQVVVGSAHNGREPQVAKIYQELQHNKNCQDFSENMIKDKADYFLLLQHGGGRGNRWAVSNKDGDVIASGQSFTLGRSVTDACSAIAKDSKSSGTRQPFH